MSVSLAPPQVAGVPASGHPGRERRVSGRALRGTDRLGHRRPLGGEPQGPGPFKGGPGTLGR
jgi:hypothetical protein